MNQASAQHIGSQSADYDFDTVKLIRESALAVTDGGFDRVRALRFKLPGFDPATWQKICDMGWLGLRLPQAEGGSGLGLREYCALAEEFGGALMPEPLIACTMAAAILKGPNLQEMLAGNQVIIPAWQESANSLDLVGATRYDNGCVTGTKRFIPFAAGADGFLVSTNAGWVFVERDADGVKLTTEMTQDGGHFGLLVLERCRARRVGDIEDAHCRAFDEAALATAAYLLGLMDKAFGDALDYLKARTQFGQKLSNFQILQHRAVDLKIQLELTRASIASAIETIESEESTTLREVAVSRAKVRAVEAAGLITRQAIQLHGAIGYTDEANPGLFLRKAMVFSGLFGSTTAHRKRYANAVSQQTENTETPIISLLEDAAIGAELSSDEPDLNALDDEAFRKVVRSWVEANYPPELRSPPKRLHFRDNKPWYMALAKRGWLAPAWPKEYGGLGLSATKQIIMIEEMERHGCARVNDMGMTMIGPLLIRFGTETQRKFYLPKILSGEHIWCQGYSEPNAGSDLASLRTSAILDGDHWIVNGQKIWTTLANDANWMFMLVRTDKNAKPQEGISFLVLPMNSPGISVRPIINLDMHDEFCEVFFDNVRVPKENLVGEINKGWSMAKALLGFERIMLGSPKQSAFALSRLRMLAEHLSFSEDPPFKDRYVRLRLDLEDLRSLNSVYLSRARRGEPIGADVSMLKIFQSELYQRISEEILEFCGEAACMLDPLEGNRDLHPSGIFIQARPSSIYGGTNEIQRNIIAKAVLGLQ